MSSANLNGRSMRRDTETGVELDADDAAGLFERCTRHWLNSVPQDATPAETWARRAGENAATPPEARDHFLMPHDAQPAQQVGRRLWGIPEEIV